MENRGESVENEPSMIDGDLESVSESGRVNTGVGDKFLPELGECLSRVSEYELGDWEETMLERLPARVNMGIGNRVRVWIGFGGRL